MTQHYSSSDSAKRTVTDTRSVRRPAASFWSAIGSYFLRPFDDPPKLNLEKVMEGCAVIQAQTASSAG